ncbi:peptide-methionine (S)-S-oxide reductase MsrA [Robertkochia sediminum]|uniref:peptide-methionine (S)-S-oxide reductase MsrA n=1 Tax=Robertkochia sediminum TaxID=2785326 RepID=UPI00193354E3|nr:peptide-methionine (S)-S-oxide reductase MsrA [Robertkochia sediminum]MBL7473468.1 peptide-methionine (S)-S-oxide reductase MsrA [Robertkochia sediminum]
MMETAYLAGGCFWCTEAVFEQIEGVNSVISGYTGGLIKNPAYREICTGRTGHAEAVKITFDPEVVSFRGLLEVFFATHDPTTLNRQGNDMGTQYRSGIFYTTPEQREQAQAFIELLTEEKVFDDPIVTEITAAGPFYAAEEYHQDYYALHREQPYCRVIIDPKIKKLKQYYSHKLKTKNAI